MITITEASAVVAALAAAIYTAIQCFQYKASTVSKACITLTVEVIDGSICIVIRNVGPVAVYNVKFYLSRQIPLGLGPGRDQFLSKGPLIEGISCLPPGGQREVLWGGNGSSYPLLEAAFKKAFGADCGSTIKVDCCFKAADNDHIKTMTYELDYKSIRWDPCRSKYYER